MAEHVPGKPHVGKFVDYFNPKLLTKIGLGAGHRGRGDGPYAALVTNNVGNGLDLTLFYPSISPMCYEQIPHKDDANSSADTGYWDWQTPTDAARAAKEVKDAAPAE